MSKPMRMQAPFISENEVKRVVAHIARTNKDAPGVGFEFSAPLASDSQSDFAFNENDDEDELYGAAKQAVVEAGKASTSYLQRKLRIGYARAARLMDILEERGVIGPSDGAKPREIIGAGNADELAREPEETEEERV